MSHWQFQMEKSPVNPYESDALPTVVMVYGGPIWRFFELVVFHNGRSPKAKCLSCGHCVDRSRATTMKWHLARCHPLKFNMYRHLVKEGRPAIPLTIAIPKEIGSDSGNEHAEVEGFFFKCFITLEIDYVELVALVDFCLIYQLCILVFYQVSSSSNTYKFHLMNLVLNVHINKWEL